MKHVGIGGGGRFYGKRCIYIYIYIYIYMTDSHYTAETNTTL